MGNTADGNCDCHRAAADIRETQLAVHANVVIPGEPVGRLCLLWGQAHRFREAGPGCASHVSLTHGGDDIAALTLHLDRAIVDGLEDPRALSSRQGDGGLSHAANGDRDGYRTAADIRKADLGVQVNVVIPGEPIGCVQLGCRYAQDFREVGPGCASFVSHAQGGDDVAAHTLHLDRAIVDEVVDTEALANRQGDGSLSDTGNGDRDCHRAAADVRKTQLAVQLKVVVPGEPVGVGSLVGGQT